MEEIQVGSSGYPLTFLMIDSSDHINGKTGLSPTVKLSKRGAAGVTPAGTVSEIDSTNAPGWYKVATHPLDVGTLGPLILHATGTGADPVDTKFLVVAYNPESSGNLGLIGVPSGLPGSAAGVLLSANASNQASLNLTQAVPTSNTAETVGDALNGARVNAFGKWVWNTGVTPSSTLVLYAANGTTAIRTFYLNSLDAPTVRV